MPKILGKNGRIWNGEQFFYADILTDGDKIVKIEPNICDEADFVFDATDKTISAGLVDAHVHFQGISSDAYGINAEMSCLPFGVTSAADAGGQKGDKFILDNILVKNKVFVSVPVRNNHANFENTEKMIEGFGDRVMGLKICFDTATGNVFDITPLKEVVDYADKYNMIITVHSTNSPVPMAELVDVLRKGDILTHTYHGGENTVSKDGFECLKVAGKKGIVIDAGMAGHIHTDFKVFGDAIKAGEIPDIISTDITKWSAYKRGGRYGLPMCMSIARHLGMCEDDIFRSVTSNPAKALEMDAGYLRVGGCADIAVLEYTDEGFDLTDKAGNHIFSDTGYRNILTITNGEIVYRR